MPVVTRHQKKRANIKTTRRNPTRDARTRSREHANEQRQIALDVRRLRPTIAVSAEPTVCVKPVRKIKLKLHQRKLRHLCGTSFPEHPAYTRCPKMWGETATFRCSSKNCNCRGRIHGAHVSFRVARRSKVRQFGIVATCASCNMRSGSFRCRRGVEVFVLARVRSMYPSIPYNPTEDAIIDEGIFENNSRIDRFERELTDMDPHHNDGNNDMEIFGEEYFRVVQ